MKTYSFCKVDGEIMLRYIPICEYIIQSKMRHREVTRGRYDEKVEEYDCYETPNRDFYTKEMDNYVSKIREICDNFNVKTREWYGFRSLSVDLIGANTEKMIKELKILLRGR